MIALAALVLAAAPAETPRAFLTRLYARYQKGDVPPTPWGRIYTPELVREMKLNGKLHGNEEVGLIDYDPVCQCQDMAEMKARIGEVTPVGASGAVARVTVSFERGANRQDLRIKLARTAAGWRIADIGTKEQASLLGDLQRDNLNMARKKRRR